MGLVQKGRSRCWLDDHRWWLGVACFEPSGFAKGAGLVVAAMPLWHEPDPDPGGIYLTVPSGKDEWHVEFESAEQFEPVAERLCERAGVLIGRLRKRFPDPTAYALDMEVNAEMLKNRSETIDFDAGVAWGLAGDPARAKRKFDEFASNFRRARLEESRRGASWYSAEVDQRYARRIERGDRMSKLVQDDSRFRAEITNAINANRAALHLPLLEPETLT
jgi:hypothetical protein